MKTLVLILIIYAIGYALLNEDKVCEWEQKNFPQISKRWYGEDERK